MKGNVNPFEPWRPMQSRIPLRPHASRPWRPPQPARATVEEPPFVEPVPEPPRDKSRPHPKPSRNRTEPPSPRRTPVSQWAAFVVLSLLALLCLDSAGWMRDTHLPRLAALGTSIGIFTGIALNTRRSWYTRLQGMSIALALAAIALWFVPTVQGVNLWSAYRQVSELRALPAGDVAEYQRGAAARRTLVEEFPSFAAEVSEAEQAWQRRTVDQAIDHADRQLRHDPHTALAQLQQLDKELARLVHYAAVRKDLESARRRAVLACANAVQREADDLRDKR
ncbi:MAG: hypothetical protein ACYC3I_27775 [Gemmataceae bacterium]